MQGGRILYFWQLVALALAAVAIATNLLTWLNVALTPVATTCSLLVFPLFFGGMISYLSKTRPRAQGKAWLAQSQVLGREMQNQIVAGLSPWQLMAAYAFVAYVFINFFGTFVAMHNIPMGSAPQVRMWTGHAALFLLVAAGLFRAARPTKP